MRIYRDAARDAVEAHRRYIAADPDVARRFERALLEIFDRLVETPSPFPMHGLIAIDEMEYPLFREVRRAFLPRTFPFAVFFYTRDGEPHVLAVLHNKQRPGNWGERRF